MNRIMDFIDREFDGIGAAIVILFSLAIIGTTIAGIVESIASIWRCK